jgi:hypothetical protein
VRSPWIQVIVANATLVGIDADFQGIFGRLGGIVDGSIL